MIRISDPLSQQYSTITMAFVSAMFIYLGFVLLLIVGFSVAKWVWWVVAILPLCGVILQFTTRRVLIIKAYQFISAFALAFTYGVILLKIVTEGRTKEVALLIIIIILSSLLMTMIGVYKNKSHKAPNFYKKPVGPIWENFDPKTGIITRASTERQRQRQNRYRQNYSRLNRIGPLIAGLSMLLAGSLSNSSTYVAIALIAFVITFVAAMAIAALLFQMIAILRWEKGNEKSIAVKR